MFLFLQHGHCQADKVVYGEGVQLESKCEEACHVLVVLKEVGHVVVVAAQNDDGGFAVSHLVEQLVEFAHTVSFGNR